jgi:hypothetical protein
LAQIGVYPVIFAAIYANAPNFRELSKSSALAARTKKADSNGRALLKFNIFTGRTLRMFVEIFSALANLNTFIKFCNGSASHSPTAQTLEFTASFLTHI